MLSHLGRGFTFIYFSDDGSAPAELRAACATLRFGDAPAARAGDHLRARTPARGSLLDADGRLFAAHDAITRRFIAPGAARSPYLWPLAAV
ncbi:MAG: hypothetical protein IPN13_08005 [Bacteroidetes bacterium]|nr:hypothetical protein [Bacteroidota bacterium]